MNNPDHKLIYLLWTVIGVLIIGAAVGGFLLVRHANEVDEANLLLTGNNISLKTQVKQLKETPSPTPTATPLATPEPSPTPTPKVKK